MENFKLSLPQEWVARICQLLAEHPYKQVSDILDGIKSQVGQQMQLARQGMQNGTSTGVADTTTPPAEAPPTEH